MRHARHVVSTITATSSRLSPRQWVYHRKNMPNSTLSQIFLNLRLCLHDIARQLTDTGIVHTADRGGDTERVARASHGLLQAAGNTPYTGLIFFIVQCVPSLSDFLQFRLK